MKYRIIFCMMLLCAYSNAETLFTGETTANAKLKSDTLTALNTVSYAKNHCAIQTVHTTIKRIDSNEHGETTAAQEEWSLTNCQQKNLKARIYFKATPTGVDYSIKIYK